jgi:hypothetical protein
MRAFAVCVAMSAALSGVCYAQQVLFEPSKVPSSELPVIESKKGQESQEILVDVAKTDLPQPENFGGAEKFPDEMRAAFSADLRAAYLVGCTDVNTYCYSEIDLPSYLMDVDGGRIRLIMQHELDTNDQVRTVDASVGCEWTDNTYGARGRLDPGRYCWLRQDSADYAFILGDATAHNVFIPWQWAWIVDYRWGQGNSVLGGNKIRMIAHPHVTARVLFFD